jgi:DNA-binding MarR family transcriptional regulator
MMLPDNAPSDRSASDRAIAEAAVVPVATDRRLRQFLGYCLRVTLLPILDDLSDTLAPLCLRIGTFSALAVVTESSGISQSQLALALNIKRSGAVVIVDELERAGILERCPVPGDRRAHALHATPAGLRLWTIAEAAVARHEDRLFAEAGEDTIRADQSGLDRIARSIAADGRRTEE